MSCDRLERYLGPDERLLGRWTGTVRGDLRRGSAVVGATDRRLVVLTDAGFKDIDYGHVSSIEARRETHTDVEGLDYRAVVAGGAVLAALSVVGAIVASSGALALLLVLAAVGGVATVEYGLAHRDDLDGFRRRETERRRVTVTTGDGRSHELAVPGDADLDAVLSRTVRSRE